MLIDCAHYDEGRRQHEAPLTIIEAADCAMRNSGFVWVGLHEPSERELADVQAAFGLHELAIEDAHNAHQRPKIEDYDGNAYFMVLRTARYDDAREEVDFGEVHLFIGPGYLITVRHGEASELHGARQRLEARPELIETGPASVVWAILDKIVDDYEPVSLGLEHDIEEVERGVFGDRADLTERIYFLRREVVEFARAVHPLLTPLHQLEQGAFPNMHPELQQYFRDVADHVRRVDDEIAQHRELLTSVLEANLAVIGVNQNEVVRKVSGWAAIITVPTFIASVYGMNFDHMPELHWYVGYPAALALMVAAALTLYLYFKRSGWL